MSDAIRQPLQPREIVVRVEDVLRAYDSLQQPQSAASLDIAGRFREAIYRMSAMWPETSKLASTGHCSCGSPWPERDLFNCHPDRDGHAPGCPDCGGTGWLR